MPETILTINAGSSSIKFALFATEGKGGLALVARGQIAGLDAEPRFSTTDADGRTRAGRTWPAPHPGFATLLHDVIEWAETTVASDSLVAIGHRVVHGGEDHHSPQLVTPSLLADLDRLTALAPLHLPRNLQPIRTIASARPTIPQVACFDTAFHRTIPEVARRFALPRELEAGGVRRYGFHGLSYEYVATRLRTTAPDIADARLIVAHLGNGASLCAMHHGASIETTMGFTALDGLVMGTRCGSLDPGVILYLLRERRLTAEQIESMLYEKSGLLGVSGGIASDMQTLLKSRDPRAHEAVELFVYRIVREIGALASILGGLDVLVFTGGIGEHASPIRQAVCERLNWLGIALDEQANARCAEVISAPSARVPVLVVPTDEERMIAGHTMAVLGIGAVAKGNAKCSLP